MNRTLLSLILSFFLLCFSVLQAQEDMIENNQPISNSEYQPSGGYSIFDSQPIYNSPWEWLHEQPNGNTLRWVKMWNADTWYAVGFGGTFMKTTDAGVTWFVNKWINGGGTTDINYPLYDAYFFNMNTGLACGGYGTVVRTTDAGETWAYVGVDGTTAATWYDMYFVNDTLGYVCGTTSGRLAVTTDAGLTWAANANIASGTYYSLYAEDADTILVFSSSGNLRRSTDAGVTWATINVGFSATLYANKFSDPLNGWVIGSSGNAGYTNDGGLTWTSVGANIPTTSTLYDVDIYNPAPENMVTIYPQNLNYWTGTTNGTSKTDTSEVRGLDTEDGWFIFDVSSIPDGSTIDSIRFYGYVNATNWPYWSATPLPGLDPLTATAADLKTAIEGNSGSGVAYVYSNEGSTFAPGWHNYLFGNSGNADLQAALAQDWFAMGMDSRDNLASYFVNWDGWAQTNVPYLEVYYSAPAVPTVYVTGDAANIYATTDMGASWSPVPFLDPAQPWTSTYYSTDFLAGNNFVTVGAFGLINEVNASDANIAHTLFVKAGTLYDVWAQSASGTVIACGTSSSTTAYDQAMYSTDGGDSWNVSTMLDSSDLDFNSISMVSSTTGYSAGEDHRVMKTTDGGATWFRVTDPATSTSDLETCFFVNEMNGYVFGATGLGYKTTDGGTSWTSLTTGISGTIYKSYFTDVNTGYIVGSSGAGAKTTDGGITFTPMTTNMQTSAIYSIWMVDANTGYLCGSTGKVRKTVDAGVTWDTVDVGNTSPTLYDIEFRNADNGMVVGSSGRTYYTNDGGANWEFENNSMSTIYGLGIESSSPDTSAAYTVGTNAYVMRNHFVIVPVELASFSASVNGNDVTLSWMTATELNNSGFYVERSTGEESWNNLGFVEGHGTTTETQSYSFTDKGLPAGTYNYRVKQVDFDGSFKYYNLNQEVEIAAPNTYSLSQNYPNPFNPTTNIKYSVPVDGFVNIAVYNILGEKVANIVNTVQKAGNYELTFDATNLASGMYIYRMEAGEFVSIKKMMILK